MVALVPMSRTALPNPLWGYRGMRLLREGMPAQAVVAHLTTPDRGAEQRQLHVHDANGGIAVHTGARCVDCGVYIPSEEATAGPRGPLCGDAKCLERAGVASRKQRD